jgi:PAS domain S-box-containing protein
VDNELGGVVDVLPGLVWSALPDGRVELLNRRWREYTGLDLGQSSDVDWQAAIHPEDLPQWLERWQSMSTSEQPWELELRLRRFDGAYGWFLCRACPQADASGQVVRWCGVNTDIDDRRRIETDLRAIEANFTGWVESFPGLMVTMSTTGQVELFSRDVLEYFGKTREELRNWAMTDAVHPDDLPRVVAEFTESVTTGKPYSIEHRCRRADGVYRWFQVRALAVHDQHGQITGWYVVLVDIDDIKRAEAALRESERESRLIVDSIPGLVAAFTPAGELEFVNRQVLEYFGRTFEELKRWGTDDTLHPEDKPRVVELFTHAMASGEPFEWESRARRFDGVYRWHQTRGFPLRGTDGHIVRWYNLIIDIDERKRAEEALAGSERQFRLLVETIPALVWCGTPEGELAYLNQRAVEYLGHTAESLAGGRWLELVHPDHRDATIQRWLRSATTGSSYDDVYQIRRADGQYRWIQSVGEPLHDTTGHIAQWYGLIVDIDDRKRAEAGLRKAYGHLAEAQRLSKTGSFITDLSADQRDWSDEAFRIFELDPMTRVTLRGIRELVHPEDLHVYDAAYNRAVEGMGFDVAFRIITAAGNVKHLHAVSHVMEEIAGRPLFIGAIQDVTERMVAEEALNRARSELAHVARVTALSALTASIAHEVNQPLSGIITNAGTCLRMLDADPPNVAGARETARRTIRDGHRASDVITRLRALFSKREFTLEAVDLNDATREVIALSLSDLQRNRIILQSELADDLPPVTGDRVQLQQVLLNLLRNASDAMAAVEDRPRQLLVRTGRDDEDDRVRVTVRDTGVGIHGQSIDKLFDAFYTTKKDGMGIGLSVSRSIIESHHGRIWATPNEGPGATFAFSIPCRQIHPPEAGRGDSLGAAPRVVADRY